MRHQPQRDTLLRVNISLLRRRELRCVSSADLLWVLLIGFGLLTLSISASADDPALFSEVSDIPPVGVDPSDWQSGQSVSYGKLPAYFSFFPGKVLRRLEIPFGQGLHLRFENTSYTKIGDSRELWKGSAQDVPGSLAVLTRSQDAIAGSIFLPGMGHFQIQRYDSVWHRILKIDSTHQPECPVGDHFEDDDSHPDSLPPRSIPPSSGASERALLVSPPPSDPVLNILVLYTPDAMQGAGGSDGMIALTDTLIAELNQAFQNSGIHGRAQLAYQKEVQYVETGDINADFHALQESDSDDDEEVKPILEAHSLRRQFAADLVCLLVEKTQGPLGVATVMTRVDASFAQHAFCVVQRPYANTYLSFAHEIGHLLGCQHDRPNATGPGAFPFSYGYRFAVNGTHYHTVMATPPGLPVLYFSNPSVSYQGTPTGIDVSQTNAANNAETINRTIATVASFSDTLTPPDRLSVNLHEPEEGQVFNLPAQIELEASVTSPGNAIDHVVFFSNGVQVGEATAPDFEFEWEPENAGTYILRARVFDSTGATADSSEVQIVVNDVAPLIDPAASGWNLLNRFSVHILGTPGQKYRLDWSDDLIHWTPWMTNQFEEPFEDESDDDDHPKVRRFYRVMPVRSSP